MHRHIARTGRWFMIGCCLLLTMSVMAQESNLSEGVIVNTDAASEGYVLFSLLNSQTAYLIDKDGQLINQWHSRYPIVAPYLQVDGSMIAAVFVPQLSAGFPIGGTGRIEHYDWDGNLVWSVDYAREDRILHHDIAPMPDGNILAVAYERVPVDRQRELGITPRADEADLFYDVLIEIDGQTGEIVWEWRVIDHLVQDEYPDVVTYGIPADFPQRFDPNYHLRDQIAARLYDRTHINGIDYHPERDQVVVSVWYTSEVWVIDRQTDALVYRWGNPAAYNRGTPEQQQLFFQHDPTWQENGNLLIFNNGWRLRRMFSSVVEIAPPYQTDGSYRLIGDSAYEPLDAVWEYRAEPQTSFFASSVSGAQGLASSNVLITDGTALRLFEITRSGEVVWEFDAEFLDTLPLVSARIFKARHYPPEIIPASAAP